MPMLNWAEVFTLIAVFVAAVWVANEFAEWLLGREEAMRIPDDAVVVPVKDFEEAPHGKDLTIPCQWCGATWKDMAPEGTRGHQMIHKETCSYLRWMQGKYGIVVVGQHDQGDLI